MTKGEDITAFRAVNMCVNCHYAIFGDVSLVGPLKGLRLQEESRPHVELYDVNMGNELSRGSVPSLTNRCPG